MTTTTRRRAMAAISTATLGLVTAFGLGGCGDDSTSAGAKGPSAAPSTADFCAEMQKFDDGDDSGPFTAFYDKHPEPTPSDWAQDGHLVTEALEQAIDEFGSVRPSADAAPLMADVLAAFEVMKQNSLDVIEAGTRDDQAAIDALEAVNQHTNVPGLMATIEEVTHLCEASAS